ncbi:phasin family protein [Bradyrhizobium sp. BR 10261]|uniref:phasin family protein n=1 Tax=Bradyrhizobium sp. BR 10261 TaxID=2749992 RepID=UPI001C6489F9|nr:phasin family protein [Bradyrhizobium sp. BR 10261]MBW7963528.1 phasin family protein [Bradyrhizobium sp. BR 10261]
MGKARSKRPADVARAGRRSLLELAAEVSRAVDEGLAMPPGSVAVAQDAPQIVQEEPAPMTFPVQGKARVTLASPQPPGSTTTDLIVDMAKAYQARALDGMSATFNYANDLAKSRLVGVTSEANGTVVVGSEIIDAIGTAAEWRAVVLELMKVNAGATLEYAQELGRAKTLAELVELSATHARKQCELVLEQTELLRSVAQRMTKPSVR